MTDPIPRTRVTPFVPPRFACVLPPFCDAADIKFATKLRAAIRRNIARGRADATSHFAVMAAALTRRRAAEAAEATR